MGTQGRMLCTWLLLLAATPVAAGEAVPRQFILYVQQAWPKQTATNNQIQSINATFGTNFDDWSDVPNLSLGAQVFWTIAPAWEAGFEVDYSRGDIQGSAEVPTIAGPATLSFKQEYDTYADIYAVAKWRPLQQSQRFRPFLFGGIGLAYESDTTTLTLRNEFIDSGLRVENDGWFPTYTVGLGADLSFSAGSPWSFEFGVAYVWARMTNQRPATGDLAPAPTVTADSDLTGPNYWLGFARSF